MPSPVICLRCAIKSCRASSPGDFDICPYGVAYCNRDGKLLFKDAMVPLSLLSSNLRHELHRMLAAIFAETIKVDSSVTKERVDPTNPASKIIGLTIMIDHFAEMLAGVNEFHPTTRGAQAGEPRNLAEVVEKYFAIHSIIKNERRPSSLELCVSFDRGLYILSHADIFEYIISLLLDNAWKYSLDGTTVTVSVPSQDGSLGVITFTNISKPLPAGPRFIYQRHAGNSIVRRVWLWAFLGTDSR